MAGGDFPTGVSAPRAVSKAYFNEVVCPNGQRSVIRIKAVNKDLEGKPVKEVLDTYVKLLRDVPDGCVELAGFMEHPFDFL